jgi:hypothetical protein
MTVLPRRIQLADRRGQQRIEPQPIVVVEVLVTQYQAIHSLPDELADTMLDEIGLVVIDEQPGESIDDVRLRFHFTEKQCTPIGADGSAIEFAGDRTLAQRVKLQLFLVTLCH